MRRILMTLHYNDDPEIRLLQKFLKKEPALPKGNAGEQDHLY